MKFKIGDKVRILENGFTDAPVGSIQTVLKVDELHEWLWTSPKCDFHYVEVELVKDTKPTHYQTNSIDVIDLCNAYKLNFNRGNVVKYIARAGKKDNELEDLEKALDYLQREIEFLNNNK